MERQSMPAMAFDPDIPLREREIRAPGPSANRDMRSERECDHEPPALRSR